MTRPSTKKVIKITCIAVCLLGFLLLLFPGYVAAIICPPFDRFQASRLLSTARTPEKLRVAVGRLGAFFPLRDGSWVAVRYTDSHADPGYSCAVAYDSGGQWLYSNYHFCGRFKIYFLLEKQLGQLTAGTDTSESDVQKSLARGDAPMFALANATNLTAARAQLLKMGFNP